MVFSAAVLVGLQLVWIAQVQAVVINIDSSVSGDPLRYSGSPVTSPFQAGSYSCTIVSPSDTPGALYSDWTAWGDTNRLTAYEITTSDRILVASGGASGPFALTNNRTVIFTLTNDTTLLFGVPDTYLADNDGGVSLLITPYIFFDGFDDNAVDTNKWTPSGNTVTEANQMMQVLTTVTDGGGALVSVPVPMSPVGDVTITRRVFVHYANDNFVGSIAMRFGNLPLAAVLYGDASYSDATYMPRYGTFMGKNVAQLDYANISLVLRANQANISAAYPVLWDTWFSEKLIYSPTTGILHYYVNEQEVTDYFIGIMPTTANPTIQFGFRAWGWWTGHEELFGDFLVTQNITSPVIFNNPVNQVVGAGSSVTFTVQAAGASPIYYQWRFNGQNIVGATSATLIRNSATAADSGGYSVAVWNACGSVTSATASLAVLTEGASGTQPAQQVCPVAPSPTSQDTLVVVTHGFQLSLKGPLPMPSWVTTLGDSIQANAPAWSVTPLDWTGSAWGIDPELALTTGSIVGSLYGKQLAQKHWQRVHLIGHSAGGAVIQAIADQLRSSTSPPVVQMTFLDPYLGIFHEEQGVYGQNADWADCYFTQDWTGGFTSGNVSHAYNVDVDWADPNRWLLDYGSSQVAFSTHDYSHDFYIKSVVNIDPVWCGKNYGFRLSAEGGGEANQASHPIGNGDNPNVLCGPPGAIPTPNLPLTETSVSLGSAAHALSEFGATLLGDAGAWLSSVSSNLTPKDNGSGSATNGPAWLAVGLTITNMVNFVRFDAGFTDTNSAEGLLTVYWNTNQIGMVDERVAPPGLRTYRFALPATLTNSLYTLSFRLDAFKNTAPSATVTNVATGFVGITQPINLDVVLLGSSNTPILKLTATPGYNYLVQSSTNLVDWLPMALLMNTNGSVLFADPAVTNSLARFYRAVMP